MLIFIVELLYLFTIAVLMMSDQKTVNSGVFLSSKLPKFKNAVLTDVKIRYKILRDDKVFSPAIPQLIIRQNSMISHREPELEPELNNNIEAPVLHENVRQDFVSEQGLEEIKESDFRHRVVKGFTEGYTGIILYVLGLALIIVSAMFFVSKNVGHIESLSSKQFESSLAINTIEELKSNHANSKTPKSYDLKVIVSGLIQDEDWDIQKIHFFKKNWQNLTRSQQLVARDAYWFQSFENHLSQELTQYKNKNTIDHQLESARMYALIDLANLLNLTKTQLAVKNDPPTEKFDFPIEKISNFPNTTATPNSVSSPRQKLDLDAALLSLTESSNNDVLDNKILDNKVLSNAASHNKIATKKPDSLIPDKHIESSIATGETVTNKYMVNGLLDGLSKNKTPDKPTYAELQDLTLKFVRYYESGNLKKLKSLFSRKYKNESNQGFEKLNMEFENLFSKSTDRQMFISGLDWSIKENQATGTGKLEVIILSDTKPHILSHKSKIRFVTSKQNNKLYITKLQQLAY